MQYQSFLNSISRGVLAPVYLIYGEEEYLQEQIIKKLKEKLVDADIGAFNLDEIDGEKTPLGSIVGSANTLPVFADKRLVIVNNLSLFQAAKKDSDETADKEAQEKLLKYLEDPLASTCLVFWVRGPVDKRKKLVKTVEKAGVILQTDRLKGAQLNSWLQDEAGLLGKKLDGKALEYIVLHGGAVLRFLQNELKKLVLFAGDESTITLPMVEELLTKTSEANIFILVDSIGLKKGEKALLEIRNLLSSGEPALRILFMIARQFRLIFRAKDLERSGFTEKQMTGELGVHPFVTGKILRQSKNFTFSELEKSLLWILECDEAMKTGAPPRQSLEDLILKLVGA